MITINIFRLSPVNVHIEVGVFDYFFQEMQSKVFPVAQIIQHPGNSYKNVRFNINKG